MEEKMAVLKIQKWWRNMMSIGKLSHTVERESATHDTELNKSELNEKTVSVRHHKNST